MKKPQIKLKTRVRATGMLNAKKVWRPCYLVEVRVDNRWIPIGKNGKFTKFKKEARANELAERLRNKPAFVA